jgi:hypothetical protein
MPAPDEMARLLAPYGCEIVGPPPTLDEREKVALTPALVG